MKLRTDTPVGKTNALIGGFVNAVAQNVSPSCQILMLLLNPPAPFHRDHLSEVDSPEFYTHVHWSLIQPIFLNLINEKVCWV